MDELIERLEKATGPDRELDVAIGEAGGYWDRPLIDAERLDAATHTDTTGRYDLCPQYTASIDAALTLVPDGWGWGCGALKGNPDRLCEAEVGKFSLRAKTPAIALCIAALKARSFTPALGQDK